MLGSRHSFNDIADTTGDLVSLARMPRVFELDRAARTVTVDGGVRYGELCGPLDAAGFALHNLASLPHISVAGACATATHGSGDRSGNLATAVVGAGGRHRGRRDARRSSRDRDPEALRGRRRRRSAASAWSPRSRSSSSRPSGCARTSTRTCRSPRLVDHFDEITSSADSVSLFTDWRGPPSTRSGSSAGSPRATPFEPPPTFFGATRATVPIHPIRRMPTDACTEQLGVPGPWHERLPHFRMDHTPSSGAELQTEYLVPRQHAADALLAVDAHPRPVRRRCSRSPRCGRSPPTTSG